MSDTICRGVKDTSTGKARVTVPLGRNLLGEVVLTRDGYLRLHQAPGSLGASTLDLSLLTAKRTHKFQDADGTLAHLSDITGGVTDHGALTGLADDDHSQYPLLAGRATGQTLKGGIAASEDLTLESTSHATKGQVVSLDALIAPNLKRVVAFAVPFSLIDTTTETTMATLTIPANLLVAGARVELRTRLQSSTLTLSNESIRVKVGSDTLLTTVLQATADPNDQSTTEIRVEWSVYALGATAAVFPTAEVRQHGDTTLLGDLVYAPSALTIDTTSDISVTVTGQLGQSTEEMQLSEASLTLTLGGE